MTDPDSHRVRVPPASSWNNANELAAPSMPVFAKSIQRKRLTSTEGYATQLRYPSYPVESLSEHCPPAACIISHIEHCQLRTGLLAGRCNRQVYYYCTREVGGGVRWRTAM